jgi:hypothetical protein
MPDLSITHENGTCAQCMRRNVDDDRNFCEKNIRAGTCGLNEVECEHSWRFPVQLRERFLCPKS